MDKSQGHLGWKVSQQGRVREFEGYSRLDGGTLTPTQDENNSMVGQVIWQDDHHFTFKILEGGLSDPGLAFAKSSGTDRVEQPIGDQIPEILGAAIRFLYYTLDAGQTFAILTGQCP